VVTAVTGQAMAWDVAASTPDPELPLLTIGDLGILRCIRYFPGREHGEGGHVVVTITPTYSGCPAMHEISADVRCRLIRAGFPQVTVRTQLSPAWSTDWITPDGRRKLAQSGIVPPPRAPSRTGPVPLTLGRAPSPQCPRCGSPDTRLTAQFSATACKSLHRCTACGEPFEAVKAI
jgi:ring-1,2-phenylacetyl-CoA epoxidase subunit PaaD